MDLMSRPPLAGIGTRFAAILLDGLLPTLIAIPKIARNANPRSNLTGGR